MNIQYVFTKSIASFGALLFFSGLPQVSQAYSCASALVVANDGCAQGSFILDTPGNIATDAPFGISDWIALDTSNDGTDDSEPGIVLLTIATKNPNLGIWGILSPGQNPWDTYDDLMITLQSSPGDYVAYSLRQDARFGLYYISPDESALNHARLWGTLAEIPLPASVWLFGAGLIGLVAAARRGANIS